MKFRFNILFLFLAFSILFLSIILYRDFEQAKEQIYNKIFEHIYSNVRDVSQNYKNYLLKFMPFDKNWYYYLQEHPKLKNNLELSLGLLSSSYTKYIYLLEKEKNGKFVFLADASNRDKANFGETFTPLRIKEFEKFKPHYFFHTKLKSIWITYIYPIKENVILVVDMPLTLLNYIKDILEDLSNHIKSILIFIFITIILLIIFSYFDRKREIEKEKILNKLKETNEILELKVEEKLKEVREKDALLLNQSKLASLGEMMNMVAHQWRQPLNALSAYAVKIDLEASFSTISNEQVKKFSKYVQEQTQTMSNIINDFMGFAKPEDKPENFYLQEVVDEVLKVVKSQLEFHNIKVETNIKKIKLKSYKKEIIHILLNLIANAKDVLIEREIQEKKIKIYNEDNKIILEDNAGGIEVSIRDKIFDPYFTTKFEGKGTGLGLYMSKKIAIEKLNGDLYFEDGEEGTKFILFIGK